MNAEKRRIPPILLILWMALGGGRALAQSITEFPLPSPDGHPLNIAPGPDGMWFTEETASRIGRIDTTGFVTEFPVNRPAWGIVTGPDGNLWFTSDRYLSRMTPAGVVTDFAISETGGGVTNGPDGNIWFTESSHIGRASPDGRITEYVAQKDRGSSDEPWFIASGPDGNLWFTDFGEFAPTKVARITPAGVLTEFGVPMAHAGAIVAGPDGNIWFTALDHGGVGRMSPSGETVVFAADAGYGIASGRDGNLWFTSLGQNKIFRMSTGGASVGFDVPTPQANLAGIAAGPDGNIWFTEEQGNRIGRVNLLASSSDRSLSLAGGRIQISVEWQSPTSFGSGHAVALTPDTGYFWFFDSTNVELIVKALDACALSGHEWVFAGGLTNLAVTMTVTDTQTGFSKTYTNPQGTAFLPIQDTGTFECSGTPAAGAIAGAWTGTFNSFDLFDCDRNVPAQAVFTQEGPTVDGTLDAAANGCGASSIVVHTTLTGAGFDGNIVSSASLYHFGEGSTVRGTLSGSVLTISLQDSRHPNDIPGGTMKLHR